MSSPLRIWASRNGPAWSISAVVSGSVGVRLVDEQPRGLDQARQVRAGSVEGLECLAQ